MKFLLLAVLGSCAAMQIEKKSLVPTVMRLRGGDVPALVTVGAGLIGASGVQAYISPKAGFEGYGIADPDPSALATFRNAAVWQIGLAALFLLDPEKVNALSYFVATACIMANIPQNEMFGGPKAPSVLWMVVLSTLGKYALDGKVSPWASAAIYLCVGLQFHFTPESTMKMYKVKSMPSDLGMSMFQMLGGTIILSATYIGALAAGLSALQALAATYVVNSILAVKWAVLDADRLGAPKYGPLGWAVVSAALAGLALK
jgi:hypothetical protein